MKRTYIIILIALGTFTGELFSQGGSNYSIWGIGDIYSNSSAYYEGLAGTSIAFPSENSINTTNPALWSEVHETRIVAGYRFNQNYVVNEDNHLLQNNGKLDGIHMLFSVDTSMGLSLGLAIFPYSSVNYIVASTQEFEVDGKEVKTISEYQGSGGITRALVGGSIRVLDELTIGAYGFANFGYSQTNTEVVAYGLYSYPASSEGYEYYTGSGFNIGLIVSPLKDLRIGAYYEGYSDIETECDITYLNYSDPLYGNVVPDTTIHGSAGSFIMPDVYGIGASYATGKFIIGADAAFHDFSNFNYRSGPSTKFDNSARYSIGVSRIGNKAYYAPYADKVTYNFGIGYKDLYYQIAGENISETYLSIGFEFPIVGNALINSSLTFGSRGTTNAGLVQEYFGRLMIDISLGETWFVPFRRE
jgi:hypothetical protein